MTVRKMFCHPGKLPPPSLCPGWGPGGSHVQNRTFTRMWCLRGRACVASRGGSVPLLGRRADSHALASLFGPVPSLLFQTAPPTPGGCCSRSLPPSLPRDRFLSHLSCREFCLFFCGFYHLHSECLDPEEFGWRGVRNEGNPPDQR